MKILLTADPEIPVPPLLYGGIERIVDSLVQAYVEKGHEVTLIAHPDSEVPCRLIPWKGKESIGLKNTFLNTALLWSNVLKDKYDVIHSFSRLAYLTPILPLRVPKIMSYQREPTVSQIKKALHLAKKDTLLFTGCSNYISNQIKPLANIVTVYNFVPIEKYDFTVEINEDAPLSFLGRIEPIKGTHIAIEVAQKTNRRLIIAGNVPKEGETYFKEQVQPFLTDRIQYIGPVNDKQKNKVLGESAALLMPIQWNEPFGIVMAEAMACGTPVLGFSYGAVPEIIEPGKSGFICQNINEMVESVHRINTISRSEVRRCVENRFSKKKIAADYLKLYIQMQNLNAFPQI